MAVRSDTGAAKHPTHDGRAVSELSGAVRSSSIIFKPRGRKNLPPRADFGLLSGIFRGWVDFGMIHRQTLAEQTAAHLVRELQDGRWRGELPGVNRLAVELGVSRETLRAALGLVEDGGLVVGGGDGRARLVVQGEQGRAKKVVRVMVLLHDPWAHDSCNNQSMLQQLKYLLEEAGHMCVFATKSQMDLGLDVGRICRFVGRIPADAWVVVDGSLELLQWFTDGSVPAIALGGRLKGLPIASASRNAIPAFREAFRYVIGLGHRRISLIGPRERRVPVLSSIERCLSEELAAHQIPFGTYNAPDWEPTPEGLEVLLNSLFRHSPPTVLLIDSPGWVTGVLSFLGRRGLRVPEDVSLISETMDNTLAWHRPAIAHFTCDYDAIVRQAVRWVAAVACGKPHRDQFASLAKFEHGGSIMPPVRIKR